MLSARIHARWSTPTRIVPIPNLTMPNAATVRPNVHASVSRVDVPSPRSPAATMLPTNVTITSISPTKPEKKPHRPIPRRPSVIGCGLGAPKRRHFGGHPLPPPLASVRFVSDALLPSFLAVLDRTALATTFCTSEAIGFPRVTVVLPTQRRCLLLSRRLSARSRRRFGAAHVFLDASRPAGRFRSTRDGARGDGASSRVPARRRSRYAEEVSDELPAELSIDQRPKLRRPILIAAFTGWNDAGESASGALQLHAPSLAGAGGRDHRPRDLL